MAERFEADSRLAALKKLLVSKEASTQDELKAELVKLRFRVNQSTVSRDLKKLGAIKLTDPKGQTVYRLAEVVSPSMLGGKSVGLDPLVYSIESNGQMIVVLTQPGSAPLVARLIDSARTDLGVIGTIAGDDTVFVCPGPHVLARNVVSRIKRLLT